MDHEHFDFQLSNFIRLSIVRETFHLSSTHVHLQFKNERSRHEIIHFKSDLPHVSMQILSHRSNQTTISTRLAVQHLRGLLEQNKPTDRSDHIL